MLAERFARVRRLFDTALDLEPLQRESYVRQETKDDVALGDEVLQLLAADADGATPLAVVDGDAAALLAAGNLAGAALSGFTVLRRIGAGGMGTVYEAQQQRPYRRVALKTLSLAFASERAQRRFEDEIDILARLRHPHIAQVLEVGNGRDGMELPWFAMELVEEPQPIDRFARDRGLTVPARVQLFRTVCEAVQFAHQRGVLHRDLKPANVLVDRHGQPKIIDFGIARLVDSDGRRNLTRTGELLGTLAYMSPERLEHGGDADDVGADVYALGVMLYELLAERSPFALDGVAPARAVDVLRTHEPAAPSSLAPAVPRELDWITQRAMARTKALRYATVAELIADLEHHRRNEPLLAGPPSAVYRLRKLACRHRLALAMAAIVLLALSAGLVVATAGWRRVAVAEQAARREKQTLLEVNRFQERILRGAYSQAQGRDVRLVDVVDAAAADLERQPPTDARVELGLRNAIGTSYLGLGQLDDAEHNFERGRTVAAAAAIPALDQTMLAVSNNLGVCYEEAGKLEQAERELRTTLQGRIARADDDRELAIAQRNLVSVLLRLGRGAEALPLAEAALLALRRCSGDGDVSTITAQLSVAMALAAVGRDDEADAAFDAAFAAAAANLHPDHPGRLLVLSERAIHWRHRGRLADYIAAMQELAASRERVLGPSHPRTLVACNNVAVGQQDRGDFAAAEETLRGIVAARLLAGVDGGLEAVGTGQNLTVAIRKQGRKVEAEAQAAAVRALAERTLPAGHWLIGIAEKEHGACLRELGRMQEAEVALLAAASVLQQAVGDHDKRTQKVIAELVQLYQDWQRPGQAAAWAARQPTTK